MVELIQTLVFYLVLGGITGVIAGLLGVGGGAVIVPALVWLFHLQNLPETTLMHMAIGTSLATIIVTSLSSVRAHHRHGAVLWPIFWRLTPGIIVGALLGAAVADALPGDALRIIFGIFELLVAAQMGFGAKPPPHRVLPNSPGMLGAGGIIGTVSAIVGIGGGSLTVPFLTWCNISIHQAVATSAACGLPIAVAGAAGFLVAGWNEPELPAWSIGYIYGPAFLGIALVSLVSAPLGAKLAHTLPVDALKKAFAVFLALVGIRMLLG